MKNHARLYANWTNTAFLVLLMGTLMTTVTQTTRAKSLYIIADLQGSPIPVQAYGIADDGTLTFQAEHDIQRRGIGAVGLAIDSHLGHLFVTYENSKEIQLIDGTTMTGIGTAIASGAENLAGIVYDHDKGSLYCVDRNKDKLYVYDWDASTATLEQVLGSPFTLTGATAYGIALDETNDLLYVANRSTTIRVYRTSDWSPAGTISVSRTAISIAIDDTRGFVYFGGGFADNDYLTQYNLATGAEAEVQVEPDGGVMGLGVDPRTGFVYITTGRNNAPGGDNIRVYDTALNEIDVVAAVGNPTGLVIPRKDIGYNLLQVSKNVVWSAMDEVESVHIGGTIIYSICFDNISKDRTATNVSIVDTLPHEVSFITADGDGVFGQYDPDTHTYVWSYPSVPPDSPGPCLKLVAQVNQDVAPGAIISNSATIKSDETGPATASVDVVTESAGYKSLNLRKNIIKGAVEQSASSDVECAIAGDTIIYGICFDNNDNDYTTTNVSIVDILPKELRFITADGDGIFGQYDPDTHTYTWFYPCLGPRLGTCLKLTVQVDPDTTPCTVITNSVTIESRETSPVTASVDVLICESFLEIGDPIAHWKMDDNAANTVVRDSSGRDNHGTAQRNTSTLATTGMINGALLFDGASDYVEVPDRKEWTLSDDFTITLWARFDAFDSKWWWESAFVGHDEGPYERNKWIFSYDPRQRMTIFHINGPDPDYPFNGYAIGGNEWTANVGVWYFVGVSRKGNTYTFYRDGVADGSEINSVVIPNISAPLTIGWAERPGKFDGALDDVRIYDKALSGEEIAELYKAGLRGSLIIPCQ